MRLNLKGDRKHDEACKKYVVAWPKKGVKMHGITEEIRTEKKSENNI
jgi:hypothetical protein